MKYKVLLSALFLACLSGCDINSLLNKHEDNTSVVKPSADSNTTNQPNSNVVAVPKLQNEDNTDKTRYFIISYLYVENNMLSTEQVMASRKDGTFPSKAELVEYIIENSGDNAKNIVPFNIQEVAKKDYENYTSGLKSGKSKK